MTEPALEMLSSTPCVHIGVGADLSRYGRIDLPRAETEFCRRHLAMFDLAFELIYSDEPAVRYSLARWLRLPGTPGAFGSRLL